jgi:hypothetical protein
MGRFVPDWIRFRSFRLACQVTSAVSHPVPQLHPNTVRVLREDDGIDLEPRQPRSPDAAAGRRFNHLITSRDDPHGTSYVRSAATTQWSLPDPSAAPAAADTDRTTSPEFRVSQ